MAAPQNNEHPTPCTLSPTRRSCTTRPLAVPARRRLPCAARAGDLPGRLGGRRSPALVHIRPEDRPAQKDSAMTQPASSTARSTALNAAAVDALEAQLRGPLVRAGSAGYEDARPVHNKWIDVRPQLIAQCQDVADVIAGVAFAREQGIDL